MTPSKGWVSALSFATVWFRPFPESQYGDFINAECADENLFSWGRWMSDFARTYARFIDGAEVCFGMRSFVRDQEERVRAAFADIPGVDFTTD